MATPQAPDVREEVLPINSIARIDNLGRWKSARLAPMWLVDSIREHGLLEPILVRPRGLSLDPPNKPYVLVAGEKRLLAVTELGDSVIRASVRSFVSAEKAHAAAIVENLHRTDLSLHDEMQVVARYSKRTRRSPAAIAHDLQLPLRRVQTLLKASEQMAPDLMFEFSKCQSRLRAKIFLIAANKTKDHGEQRDLVYNTSKTSVRRRPIRDVQSAIEMLRTAEVVAIRSLSVLKDAPETRHLRAATPLTPRERDLISLCLQWTLPQRHVRTLLPLQGTNEDKLRKERRAQREEAKNNKTRITKADLEDGLDSELDTKE